MEKVSLARNGEAKDGLPLIARKENRSDVNQGCQIFCQTDQNGNNKIISGKH
jgi:hypothetical protein